MQTEITTGITPIGETSGATSRTRGGASYHSGSGLYFEQKHKAVGGALRGEITKLLPDGTAVVILPDKETHLHLPTGFSVGDALYGLFAPDGSWNIYALPSAVIRKNTPFSVLEVFGFPKNYLHRISLEALASYMPVISRGDIALFVAAAEFIGAEFHLSESDSVGLTSELHSQGAPLNAASLRKATPSAKTQTEFRQMMTELIDLLDGDYLPFRQKLEALQSCANDFALNVREKLRLFLIGIANGKNSTFFGILTELLRAKPPENIAKIASALLETIESRYFMNLCALAANLPMRLWIISENEDLTELTIYRSQKEKSVQYTVSITIETDALGPTGIRLASFESDISAHVYAANDTSRDILADCANDFSQSLGAIGFSQRTVGLTTSAMPAMTTASIPDIRISI